MTLRELLLVQSIYVTKTQKGIVDIVRAQPNPSIFYKSFWELEGTNLTSILSFDSRSMEFLLADRFQEYFSTEHPLFYLNKFRKRAGSKIFYRNAMNNALISNQVGSVRLIINYIIKY